MKAEVHYVAGYLKQAGEQRSGAAAADAQAECEEKSTHHHSGVAHWIL